MRFTKNSSRFLFGGVRASSWLSHALALALLASFSNVAIAGKWSSRPTISGSPPTSATVGIAYSFTPSASDPNGDALTFSIRRKPAWATFNRTTGRLSGTPAAADVGTYTDIVIRVTDGSTYASLPRFSIVVRAATNTAPTISGTPPTSVMTGSAYSFTPSAADANGDALTFSIESMPTWATFSASTGRLQGTPSAAHVGQYVNIRISVSDGIAIATLPAFAISVTSPNSPPTISGTPGASVIAGTTYSFTPSANDADGDALTFSVTNPPSWASFSSSTGRLTGVPTAAHVGTYSNIGIRVSDGTASASLPSFAIAVTQVGAGQATVSWTAPTTNTDGSPLTNLAGYKVLYGTSAENLNQQIQIANAGISTHVVDNLNAGTYYFGVKAYNSSGLDSDLSNIVSKIIQ